MVWVQWSAVVVCVKFVEQLFTFLSTFLNCPIIGTLSHNTYNKVLKFPSLGNLKFYLHMVGFCGPDCICVS